MSNPRELAADQDGVVSSVRGGLDLVSSRLTMPAENSPDLLNVEVLRDGSVAKRRGARRELMVAAPTMNNNYPASYYSFNTLSGYPIVLCATNKTLLTTFYPATETVLDDRVQRLSFVGRLNVFRSGENVDFTVIREPGRLTRVLMTQQDTTPIQLSIIEQTEFEAITDGGFTARAWYAPELEPVIATSYGGSYPYFVFYGDGIPYTSPTMDARFDTATKRVIVRDSAFVSAPWSTAAPLSKVVMLWVTVQWWTEAFKLEGNQILARAVQGATTADRLVTIPQSVLSGITAISEPTVYPSYPLLPYTSTNPASLLTFQNPPSALNQYTFSNGSSNLDAPVPRSPLFLLTGTSPSPARTLLLSRGYEIPFLGGGRTFDGTTLRVVEVPSNSSARSEWREWGLSAPATKLYQLRNSAYTVATPGRYITFDSGTLANVDGSNQYIVMQPIPNGTGTYFGTAASPYNRLFDTASWVTFGITNYSTYGTQQSHPRTSCLWQGRLVLAGWKDDPLRVAVSGVEDNAITNWYYNDFQLVLAEGLPSDSFDFTLPGLNDDYITAVTEFQGRLFIFTRDRLFQMSQTESGAFVRLVANVGAANSACVTDMEGTIVFMGSKGVFIIEPTRDELDYRAVPISDNIRPVFDTYGTERGWIAYSPQHQYLFVSLGNYYEEWVKSVRGTSTSPPSDLRYQTPTQLYVYSLFTAAWSKWSGLNGDTFDNQGGCVVRRDDATTTLVYSTAYLTDPCATADITSLNYLQWEWGRNPRYADTFVYEAGASLLGSSALLRPPGFEWSARDDEREVFLDRARNLAIPTGSLSRFTLLNGGFRSCPVIDIEDVAVFPYPDSTTAFPSLTDKTLKLNTHFYKTGHNSIVLADNYFESNRVLIIHGRRNADGDWALPYAFWVDDRHVSVPLLSSLGGSFFVNNPTVTQKYEIGMCYPSWYSSPHWYRQGVGFKKRVHTFTGYYNNEITRLTRQNLGANPNDLIGSPQTNTNLTLALAYSDEQTGYVSYDIYGSADLLWDYGSLDIDSPPLQNKSYARVVVPVYGGGYNIQVWNYDLSPSTWRLVGYELRSRTMQGRGRSNTID